MQQSSVSVLLCSIWRQRGTVVHVSSRHPAWHHTCRALMLQCMHMPETCLQWMNMRSTMEKCLTDWCVCATLATACQADCHVSCLGRCMCCPDPVACRMKLADAVGSIQSYKPDHFLCIAGNQVGCSTHPLMHCGWW